MPPSAYAFSLKCLTLGTQGTVFTFRTHIKHDVPRDCVCVCLYVLTVRRSAKFFLTIEQAVVKGGKVLIEHFPSPLDPALLPIIEIGKSGEGTITVTV